MRKVLACVLSLVVGLALLQLTGCKKSEPAAKSGQPGAKAKPEQPGAAKPEQPGAAASSDPVAAASKKLVGVWKGKPPMPPGAEKGEKNGPPMEMTITMEFKDGGAAVMDMMMFKINGTWKVLKADGEKLTVNMEMEPPDLGGLMKGKEKDAKPPKETEEFTIVFQTNDKISMGPTKKPAEAIVMDRQK